MGGGDGGKWGGKQGGAGQLQAFQFVSKGGAGRGELALGLCMSPSFDSSAMSVEGYGWRTELVLSSWKCGVMEEVGGPEFKSQLGLLVV